MTLWGLPECSGVLVDPDGTRTAVGVRPATLPRRRVVDRRARCGLNRATTPTRPDRDSTVRAGW